MNTAPAVERDGKAWYKLNTVLNNIYRRYHAGVVLTDDDCHAAVQATFAVRSLTELVGWTDEGFTENLTRILESQRSRVQGKLNQPIANTRRDEIMSELTTVFPMKGGIAYRGFYFSITLRQSVDPSCEGCTITGELDTAFHLMDQFVDCHDGGVIDLSQYAVASQQHQQSAPPQATENSSASPAAGSDGRKHIDCNSITKTVAPDGKPAYRLGYLYNGTPSKYPIDLTKEREAGALTEALRSAGLSPDKWELAKPYTLSIDVSYVDSEKLNAKGNPYKNDMRFTVRK